MFMSDLGANVVILVPHECVCICKSRIHVHFAATSTQIAQILTEI